MTVCYWCGAKDTLADVGKELDNGKYKMVQCSKCKNAYYVVNKEKMNKPKPMTNEEYLRSCTTEELAEFLSKIGELDEAPIPCGDLMECSKNCGLYSQCAGDDVMPTNEEIWLEWLKQPHTTTKE